MLRIVRHSDRHSILTAYSRQLGRVAFAIPAGQGKEAARRRAILMPLSVVDCVADIRPNSEVHLMHQPQTAHPLAQLRTSPVKTAVAIFLAEVLTITLGEGPSDSNLFDFIEQSILVLDQIDSDRAVANFHIAFLQALGLFLGIAPDVSNYKPGQVFDMIDARFRSSAPNHRHWLSAAQSEDLVKIQRMTYANMHLFNFTRAQRAQTLSTIIGYYALHHPGFSSLKSLEVLYDLF